MWDGEEPFGMRRKAKQLVHLPNKATRNHCCLEPPASATAIATTNPLHPPATGSAWGRTREEIGEYYYLFNPHQQRGKNHNQSKPKVNIAKRFVEQRAEVRKIKKAIRFVELLILLDYSHAAYGVRRCLIKAKFGKRLPRRRRFVSSRADKQPCRRR